MDTAKLLLGIGWALMSLAACSGIPILIGLAVLRPVKHAVKEVNAPLQFMLTDFFWLLVQLQIALAITVGYVPRGARMLFVVFLGYLMLAFSLMWLGAVALLSRAGIRTTARRGVFILFLLPVVLILMILGVLGFIFLPIVAFQWLHSRPIFEYDLETGRDVVQQFLLGLVLSLAEGGLLWALCKPLRKVTDWILAESPVQLEQDQPVRNA